MEDRSEEAVEDRLEVAAVAVEDHLEVVAQNGDCWPIIKSRQ